MAFDAAPPPVDYNRGEQRMLPNDMLAEQSALGGMLLSQEACAEVFESVKGSDFYAPKHETIFRAVYDLYGRGEPAADERFVHPVARERIDEPGRIVDRSGIISAMAGIEHDHLRIVEQGQASGDIVVLLGDQLAGGLQLLV